MNNEMINRYLYDVVRRLPEKQKVDIEKELRTLIEDMAEEKSADGEITDDVIRQVLEELGDPAKLAAKYRDDGFCLISGEYYPLYCQVLKIVLICVGAGMAIAYILSFFVNNVMHFNNGLEGLIEDTVFDFYRIPSSLIQAFGWVTLIFFIMQKKQVKIDKPKKDWSLHDLPAIPDKKAVISRGESLFGVICGLLLIILFIAAPNFCGVFLKGDSGVEYTNIPIFNTAIYPILLPLFCASLMVGIINDAVKLVHGRYNLSVMITDIITKCISIILAFVTLKGFQIWNPNFAIAIQEFTGKTFSSDHDIMSHWNQFVEAGHLSNILLIIIVVSCVADILITIYRTMRYGMRGTDSNVGC